MHPYTIEATVSHRHTAPHFLRKVILIVSTLMGIIGMNSAQAVTPPTNTVLWRMGMPAWGCVGVPVTTPHAGTTYISANPVAIAEEQCQAQSVYFKKCITQGVVPTTFGAPSIPVGYYYYPATNTWTYQFTCTGNYVSMLGMAGTPCAAGAVVDPTGMACVQCLSPNSIDPATGQCRPSCVAPLIPDALGTSCVAPPPPPVAPTCPIADLPAITDPEVQTFENNPNLSDTTRLTPAMQTALTNLTNAATSAGGTPTVGSAFRPPAYNQHLIDVWNKRDEFLQAAFTNPEVASNADCLLVLWPKIQRHFQNHGLLITQPPVPNSRHTKGLAFDMTINLPAANIDALAVGAGLRRPLPVTDPVHFQFP